MSDKSLYFEQIGQAARKAAVEIAKAPTQQKNQALLVLAELLEAEKEGLFRANALDIENGKKNNLSEAFLDRLCISEKVLRQMMNGLKQIASLNDPIGEILSLKPQPSGIRIGQMRVPLGVIGIIYESRPNVID